MSDQQDSVNPEIEALKKQVAQLQEQLKLATEDKELKKINQAIEDKLEKFKEEQFKNNLESAHRVYEQAAENEKLAQEERDSRIYDLREAKIVRLKKNMVDYIKQIQHLIDTKQYPQDFFSSDNQDPKVAQYRDFYYQICTRATDPEKFVDDFFERHKRETNQF